MNGLSIAALLLVSLSSVTSIRIDSSWGGLGPAQSYHGVIRREGDAFVRDDGTVVSGALIDAFLKTLDGPHPGTVVPADVGLTENDLRAHVSEAEQCLQQSGSVAPVRAAFEQIYFNEGYVQQWLDDGFRGMHTDDYPHITVHIAATSGDVTLQSDSQHLFMLPFRLTQNGQEEHLFDPRIPHALAAIMPANAANVRRMQNGSLLGSWASSVCMSKPVRDAQDALGKDGVAATASRYGLQMRTFAHNFGGDVDQFTAVVGDASNPRIAAEVQSSSEHAASDFALVQRKMALISRIPWLRRELAHNPNASIEIISAQGGHYGYDASQFRQTHHPHAAALMEAHPYDTTILWLNENADMRESSTWYLYPDGTMILEDPKMSDPPPAFGPNDAYEAGAIVYPDGRIEKARP